MMDSFCKAGPESQTQANLQTFFLFTEHYGQSGDGTPAMTELFTSYFVHEFISITSASLIIIVLPQVKVASK